MDIGSSVEWPPVTQLRPLHTYQQSLQSSNDELLHWTSSFEPGPDQHTAIKAFVKLVSRLIILDEGESFCIEDSQRGGYILAHSAADNIDFVQCASNQDIPTHFSIGEGKDVQLHIGANGEIRLTVKSRTVPEAALQALGSMFDDVLRQESQTGLSEWSQPSVLNFPPRAYPMDLAHQDGTHSNHSQSNASSEGKKTGFLHSWFEQRAVENPETIAIDYLTDIDSGSRVQLTYRQVYNIATTLAIKITELTAKSSQSLKTVAVLMGPCPELYISYLAALETGVAFCPIAVDAPRERKEALMADLNQQPS